MKKNNRLGVLMPLLLAMIIVLLLQSCISDKNESSDDLEIYVTIPPVAYIVDQIGGENVSVHVLVQPGQSPHSFELSPRQMMSLGNAKIYFGAGFPFETILMKKIQSSYPEMIVQNLFPAHDHSHSHSAHDNDPHVWLSPHNIVKIAEDISAVLQDIDPGKAVLYRNNLHDFKTEVDRTHTLIGDLLAPYKGAVFYVFHPAFGHFSDAYGLRQVAVEVEGKSPSPRQIEKLIEQAKADDVHIIFTQPQFDPKSAENIAVAIDGSVEAMDPLEYDILMNLQQMAVSIKTALDHDSTFNK